MIRQQVNSNTRPRLFRALGCSNPPDAINVNDRDYQRIKIIKHDSWAATALYRSSDTRPSHKVVCKFNRTQPIGPVPMFWLGKRLAEREYKMYDLLADIDVIAKGYMDVTSNETRLPNACAHDYIEGHPLRWHDAVKDDFFDQLDAILMAMHQRDVAYVDMNKAENVIINTNGDPCLIDFQISVHWTSFWLRGVLRILQKSDLYHSFKMKRRHRPDLVDREQEKSSRIPWWIQAHRIVANPFRATRRRLLVALGIRKGKGMPQSEAFVEEALAADGNDGETVKFEQPILRLYRILRGAEYVDRFRTGNQYIAQLFVDLFVGAKLEPVDKKLIRRIRNASDHNIVVGLLKSKTFFMLSDRWNRRWIEQKIQTIEQSLNSSPIQMRQQINTRRKAA